jgi:hypothetical protein
MKTCQTLNNHGRLKKRGAIDNTPTEWNEMTKKMYGIRRALPRKSVHDFKGSDTNAEGIQYKIENLAHEAGFDDVQTKVLALHSEKSWNEDLFQFG